MNAILKKLTISSYIAVAISILSLVAVILYGANITNDGYFQNQKVESVVMVSTIAIILPLCTVVPCFVKLDGLVGKIVDIVILAIKVAVVVLLLIVGIKFLGARIPGFGYIYFSNEEVLQEVQTPANLASSKTAIASIVLYILSGVIGMVWAFFPGRKVSE